MEAAHAPGTRQGRARARTPSAPIPCHGARDAAQDVHFLLRELGTVQQLVQARQQLLRRGGVEETHVLPYLLPVLQQALQRRAVGQGGVVWCGGATA
jgi:hypothetical protein